MRKTMRYRLSLAPILFASLALGACANDMSEYPSLAKRPVERVSAVYGVPQALTTPAPLPQPDSLVLNQLASLLAEAVHGDARFRRGEPAARRLVDLVGRARIGTEPWSLATMAVSEIEAARGETTKPLAELDQTFAEAMTRGEDVTAIANARDRVIEIVARQDAVLGDLRRRLGD